MQSEIINGFTYDFYTLKGKVVGSNKHSQTHVYGGGGDQYHRSSVSSYVTVHDIIFVQDEKGTEHEVKLENWDVGCREGHEMLFVWCVLRGAKSGPYLAVNNLSTGNLLYNYTSIKKIAGKDYKSLWMPSLVILPPVTILIILLILFNTDRNSMIFCYGPVAWVFVCLFLFVIYIFTYKDSYKRKPYQKIISTLESIISQVK